MPNTVQPNSPSSPVEPERSGFWSKRRVGIAGSCGLIFLGAGVWYALQPPSKTPLEKQRQAIELIQEENDSPHNRRLARKLALDLQEIKFHDPDFPGAAEYILGMIAFREGLAAEEAKRDERFTSAVEYLRDAERLALNSQYRPEWAYALGTSLHASGSPSDARPYIEEAWKSSPDRQQELTERLIEIYLELKKPAMLAKALELTETLLQTLQAKKAGDKDVAFAKLLKAQVLVALGRTEEALATLPKQELNQDSLLGIRIIQAQTLMALDSPVSYRNAREILQGVSSSSRATESETRQSQYLIGVCEESLNDTDRAINQFERTRSRYPKTPEGIAASLRQATLLQQTGRDEEALASYEIALKSVIDPQTYHNRWVGIQQFRSNVIQAWNVWVENDEYPNAIALSRLMPPLFSQVQSSELEARAYEKWAESYERNNSRLALTNPKTYKRESRERWNASGDAYSALGEFLRTSPKFSEVLWKSADHYIRGFRFKKAQAQLEQFIANGPKERHALGNVRLAYTLLNQDETETALNLLNRTVQENPKDPASFQALYLMGVAYLERNEITKSRETWRNILELSYLGPAAREWRDSLFLLGTTIFHHTSARVALKNNLEEQIAGNISQSNTSELVTESNLEDWDLAIGKLQEYVRRYPNSPKHLESQYLLARAFQKSAIEYQAKLESAQIANEKQELAEEYRGRLETAVLTLRGLRARLLREEERKGLNKFQLRLLQNTYFDLGDIAFGLQEYESALLVYGSAINRYPDHVRVLTTYIQMAQCYQQLQKNEEARSTLKQAQVLVNRMDDSVFQSNSTNLRTRKEWTEWFEWTLNTIQ